MELYWLEQTAACVPHGDEWLSPAERQALGRLHVPKRRADWRLGRWTAKVAIAARLCIAPALSEIETRAADSGAPLAFVRGRPAGVALSLSHSGGVGFCVLGDAEAAVGCDVERIETRSPAFLADYFTRLEQAMVVGRPESRWDEWANLLWSAKESALKASGAGLREDPRAVAVLPADCGGGTGSWFGLAALDGEGRLFHGWWRSVRGFVWTVLSNPDPVSLEPLDSKTAINGGISTGGPLLRRPWRPQMPV